MGGTVIIKSYPRTADGPVSFTAEAAGLAFTSRNTHHQVLNGAARSRPRRAAEVPSRWPMHDHRTPVPTARQLLRYRWQRLREELSPTGELPAITALMASLLHATRAWHAPDLPPYPAFR
jgi:hypothetical protein